MIRILILFWLNTFCLAPGYYALTYSRIFLHKSTDPEFRGKFLDIEGISQSLGINRLTAHEIQNHMRDQLEAIGSGRFDTIPGELIENSLQNSIDSVAKRYEEEFSFRPLQLRANEFILVLDLDGSVLSQWHNSASLVGADRKGNFTVSVPDTRFVETKDANSDQDGSRMLQVSGTAVLLRPGIMEFLEVLKSIPEFQGIVLYTDNSDQAMQHLLKAWKKTMPEFFGHVLGAFARNHFRFDRVQKRALKDLRIFDPELRNILSIDDDESRVLQPHLNYRIPSFNAQGYLDSLSETSKGNERALHEGLLPYLARRIEACAYKARKGSYGGFITFCFQAELGTLSKRPRGELFAYYRTKEVLYPLDGLKLMEVFHYKRAPSMEVPISTSLPGQTSE
ncbi:hypothetical protein HOF92_05785 [bacterium]|jgi:hypothetical protein|nr:hypothetical protein [bacterium]